MQTLGPALDHLIETKRGRLSALVGTVEHLSVDERALVVAFHLVGGRRLVAVALAQHLVLQPGGEHHHALFFAVLGKEVLALGLGILGLFLGFSLKEVLHNHLCFLLVELQPAGYGVLDGLPEVVGVYICCAHLRELSADADAQSVAYFVH